MVKSLPSICCVTLTICFQAFAWKSYSQIGNQPSKIVRQINQFIKTSFPERNINVFHGIDSNADKHDGIPRNLLPIILAQFQNADMNWTFQTFTLISAEANTSLFPKVSLLTEKPYFHQNHAVCGSVNLVLVDDKSKDSLFKVVGAVQDLMFIPSMDQTVVYQWKNYREGALFAPELKNLMYKLEIVPYSNGLTFKSLCLFCDYGEAAVIDLRSDSTIAELFPDTTKNLHGKVLRFTSSFGMPTMIDFKNIGNDTWEYFGGFGSPFLDLFKRQVNCSLTVHPIRGYGRLQKNGTFNGALGLIVSGQADFGMAGQMYDGHIGVDYLHVTQPGMVVVSTREPANALRLHAVFQAFGYKAWSFLIAVCLGFLLPFYTFINRISGKFHAGHRKVDTTSCAIQKGVKFLFHPLLEQSLTDKLIPSEHSGRLLLSFWLFCVLVISTAYKCNLRDLMISSEPEYIPSTFNELAELPEYELYAQTFGGSLFYTFKLIQSPVYKNIARRLRPTDTMLECLENVIRRPKAVCINYDVVIERETNLYFTDRQGRPLIRISSADTGAFSTVACPVIAKKSVLRNTLNSFTSFQYSMGLTQQGRLNDVREASSKGRAIANDRSSDLDDQKLYSTDGPAPMKLQHFYIVFLILVVGLTMAFIVLLIEMLKYHKSQKKSKLRVGVRPIFQRRN